MNWVVHISTFNCAKKFPFESDARISDVVGSLISARNADICVLGFQELVEVWESGFSSYVRDKLTQLEKEINKHLNEEQSARFKVVAMSWIGATAMIAYVRQPLIIEDVSKSDFRCGAYGTALKGACSINFKIRRTPEAKPDTFTFSCCHLSADEGSSNLQTRTINIKDIISAVTHDLGSDSDTDHFDTGHFFVFGDLNFRVSGWNDMNSDYTDVTLLRSLLNNKDELNALLKTDNDLKVFEEAEIKFPPTYKFKENTPNMYNFKRTPSWCDRILYRRYADSELIKVSAYEAVPRTPALRFSDHQPVVLCIEIPETSPKISRPSIPRGNIPVTFSYINENIIDATVGYGGWLISKNIHIGAIIGILLFIAAKSFVKIYN